METLIRVLAPFVTVVVFAWSLRQFSLVEWIDGRMRTHFSMPPKKGVQKHARYMLPITTVVLAYYVVQALAWMRAHWPLVVLIAIVAILLVFLWRKRTRLMDFAEESMKLDDDALKRAGDAWDNERLG